MEITITECSFSVSELFGNQAIEVEATLHSCESKNWLFSDNPVQDCVIQNGSNGNKSKYEFLQLSIAMQT